MLSVLSLVLTVPRPTLVDLPAMVPTTASHAQHWRSAAVNVLLESEGDTGISTVDLPWITAAAANCTHAASCLTHIPGGEWDRILAEQRYQMQIAPPPFIFQRSHFPMFGNWHFFSLRLRRKKST